MQALPERNGETNTSKQQTELEAATHKAGWAGQAAVATIHAANVGLLYSVLTAKWLLDLDGRKRQDEAAAVKEEGTLIGKLKDAWSVAKLQGKRFLDLSWQFGEHEASHRVEGKPTSVWLALHTSTLHEGKAKVNKGKERLYDGLRGQNDRSRLVKAEVESDEVLKLVEVDTLGRLGRGLLVTACAVPILPELLVAFAFFWAIYFLGIAWALTEHRKSGQYVLLGVLGFLHLPFVWVLWFPLVLLAFLGVVLFQSLRSRAYLATDARRVFGWLAGKEESGSSVLPSHSKND